MIVEIVEWKRKKEMALRTLNAGSQESYCWNEENNWKKIGISSGDKFPELGQEISGCINVWQQPHLLVVNTVKLDFLAFPASYVFFGPIEFAFTTLVWHP